MKHRALSRRGLVISLASGVIHAIVASWMSAFVRGRSFWAMITPQTPSEVVFVSATAFGLILLGGIPVALFYRNELVTPIITLVLLFVWAFYSSWYYFEEARATGATSISVYYDSLFSVLWFIPLTLVLLLGAIEYLARGRLTGPSTKSESG